MGASQPVTLDRYLKARGPMDPDQVARVAYQAVQKLGDELTASANGRPIPMRPGRLIIRPGGAIAVRPPTALETSRP